MTALRYIVAILIVLIISSLLRWLLPTEFRVFDLFLVTTVLVALYRPPMTSQIFGLSAGLAQDFFSAVVIGINGLTKTVVGLSIAGLRQMVLIKGWLLHALTFIAATLLDAMVAFGVRLIFSLPAFVDISSLLIRCLANAFIGVVLVFVFGRRLERAKTGDYYEIP